MKEPTLLSVINKKACPHKGYVWNDPITGRQVTARSYANWISEITAHRVANALESPPAAEAEDSFCQYLWEKYGESVMKTACAPSDLYVPRSGGPGTILKNRLQGFGINACFGCLDLAAKMDAWGPEGCEEMDNFNYIKGTINANAEQRRWFRFVPFKDMGIDALVRWVIDESRRRQNEQQL